MLAEPAHPPTLQTARVHPSRKRRLAALAAVTLAAGASIATSQIVDPVHGFAASGSFELTPALPERTFSVTVDVNAAAAKSEGDGSLTLSIMAMLYATSAGGAEVTATIIPDGMQSKSAVITGQGSETLSLDADAGFFAGCLVGQPCVRQGIVRLTLRSGAGARGSFLATAASVGRRDPPPEDAAVKVSIAEVTP